MNQAVVLGSNYYIGLSIIRCLGKEGIEVIAFDYEKNGTYGAASKYLAKQFIVPHYSQEQDLMSYLIEYSKGQTLKPVLYPTADAYVEFMDKHLNVLKDYYLFPMTEQGLWRKVMDKEGIKKLCLEFNVNIPITISPITIDWETFEDTIGYPCLLKPTQSPNFVEFYRKKLFVCHNYDELRSCIELTNKDGFEMIVQQMIVGPDSNVCTYDGYFNSDSDVTHAVTCQKIRQFPINFGASSFTIQRNIDELHTIGSTFLKAIKYKGFAEIEFKYDDKTCKYYLIEVNTRTTTLNCMLDEVGINFPYVAYQEMIGKKVEENLFKKTTHIAFRYHLEDLISVKNYIKTKQLKVLEYMLRKRYKTVHAIWSIRDVKPYLSYFKFKILRK